MTVVVELFAEFGLTVSEKKTETLVMKLPIKRAKEGELQPPPPPPPLAVEAAGQRYSQTSGFRYLGRLINEDGERTREIDHRGRAAWGCARRYGPELFDRPGAPERLKVRLLQAEAMKASLYGCVAWSPRKDPYDLLTTIRYRLLLRVLGYRRRRGT